MDLSNPSNESHKNSKKESDGNRFNRFQTLTHNVNTILPAQSVHVAQHNQNVKDHNHSQNKSISNTPQLKQESNKIDNNLAVQLKNSRLDRERKKTPTSPKRRDIL